MKDLVFADDFLWDIVIPEEQAAELVLYGEITPEDKNHMPKRITMRPGHRDFEAGEVVRGLSSAKDWQVPLRITQVIKKTYAEVTLEEALADGFHDPADITDPEKGLPRFYKPGQYDFSPSGPVTLIYFELNF